MLENQLDSFEVVSVATGRAALYRLRNDPPYDVILCDLMMGDLTGMDVYEHLKLWQPQLVDRLLFMTGGAYTQRARDLAGRTGVKLLEKPFSWEALEEAVDRVLCRSGRAESVAALKR
jgi:CheY-like chemotaxis protein